MARLPGGSDRDATPGRLLAAYTPAGVDRIVPTAGLSQLEVAMLRHSAMGPIVDLVWPDLFGQNRRGRIEQALQKSVTVAREAAGPRLVWTHVPAPHYPLVCAADGSPLGVERAKLGWFDLSDPSLLDDYRGNLKHLDTLVLAAVASIIEADPAAAVVVLSDHGSLLELGGPIERVRNLTLARTPNHPEVLGKRPTPVNLFPRLFNAYFATDLPIRPNRSYQIDIGSGGVWRLLEVPRPTDDGGSPGDGNTAGS